MPEQQSSPAKVAAVVSFYCAAALIMVMTNKWVLSTSSLPLTFLLLQLLLSVLCLHTLSHLPSTHPFHFAPPHHTLPTIRKIAPLCIVNLTGLVFNIYCLQLVDASYFQVARGLTLPITVVLQSLVNRERPTWATVTSCGIVTWGFTYSFLPVPTHHFSQPDVSAIMVVEGWKGEAPMLGMVLGVLSGVMIAIHAILVKQGIKTVEGRMLDLAYWQNWLCGLALIPMVLVSGEVEEFWQMLAGQGAGGLSTFISGSMITGIVGFLICVAGLLSIKVTSPVTHMFSSAVRSVLQTMLGVWLFHDVLNGTRIMSIFLILLGSTLYTYSKAQGGPPRPAVLPTSISAKDEEQRRPLMSDNVEKGQQ